MQRSGRRLALRRVRVARRGGHGAAPARAARGPLRPLLTSRPHPTRKQENVSIFVFVFLCVLSVFLLFCLVEGVPS